MDMFVLSIAAEALVLWLATSAYIGDNIMTWTNTENEC